VDSQAGASGDGIIANGGEPNCVGAVALWARVAGIERFQVKKKKERRKERGCFTDRCGPRSHVYYLIHSYPSNQTMK